MKKEYVYAIANEMSGMDHAGSIWAVNQKEAATEAKRLARCFGPTTIVLSVELAKQLKLPLERRKLRRG